MTLKIYLLGQFKIQEDNRSIELPSRPAQSLLAYLALNAGVKHRREKLASLLWPDSSEANARSYLRQALWRIRKAFEGNSLKWENYLQISDINISFDDQSANELDTDKLTESSLGWSVEQLIESIQVYQGELLPGFYDEWILPERDRIQVAYHQKMHLLLKQLSETGRWQEVLEWGEQWIRLGNSPEEAFRALMRAYAHLGDQTMVSAAYQRCVDALNRELSLDPSPETRLLYEQIIRGEFEALRTPPPTYSAIVDHRPRFFEESEPERIEKTTFVAREHELAELEEHLDLALSGKGHVIFVTGETGSGKSALINELTRRAQKSHPELIVASGNCNAHTGIGDPYLPFREILGLLTGDVESRWAGGTLTKEHARRLWNTLPNATQAILEQGPDLIDTFIPGASLVKRATGYVAEDTEWLTDLKSIVQSKDSANRIPTLQQTYLFEQYTRVLQALSQNLRLVLVVDDLQWADAGSIGLLFHVGRHLTGSPILLVGSYRQEEVSSGRDGSRHPLEPVINEFQREFGAITVDLGQADHRDFLEALLDSEPNKLGPSFRDMLHQQTLGHPLFTIELLRGMQERGDVVQDVDGEWIEGMALDWETMPARIEAVIAERIRRLAQSLQDILQSASIEGELFTAEILAQVMSMDEGELLSHLSKELDRQHRLIRADSIQRLDGKLISTYKFRHILFQKYLYSSLDEVERVHLHEQVGTALEGLYSVQEEIPLVALQLARHFEEAGIPEKAIHYLHQAGERAMHLSAYQEGITHLSRGLDLLHLLPDADVRDQLELTLQLTIGMAWKYNWTSPLGRDAISRALDLCNKLGKTDQLSRVLGELCTYHYVHAEYRQAIEWAEKALNLAQQEQDPILIAEGNWFLGFLQFSLGEYSIARAHLEKAIDFYDPEEHHRYLVSLRGVDAGLSAMAYDACCLWCLGYPDQAKKLSEQALTLARRFDHAFTLADVLCYAGCMLHAMLRDPMTLKECAEDLIRIATKEGLFLSGWSVMATNFIGVAHLMQNQSQAALTQIQESLRRGEQSGIRLYTEISLQSLARVQFEEGRIEDGLASLEKAMALMEQTGERHWESELHRLRAELLEAYGDDASAEKSLIEALEIARQHTAKSWELRAAMVLAKLWQRQGKEAEARDLLEPIYNWFTEGFETPDLQDAKALLDELS